MQRLPGTTRLFATVVALAAVALGACRSDEGESGNGPTLASKQPEAVAEARERGAGNREEPASAGAPVQGTPAQDSADAAAGAQRSVDAEARGTEQGRDAATSPGKTKEPRARARAEAESGGGTGKKKSRHPTPTPKETVKATVVGKEFRFSPSRITAPPGALIEIEFENRGTITHNMTFKQLPHKTPTISPDDTATLQFTAPSKPGTYKFVCKVVGHAVAGMKGQLVVEKKK